MNVNPTLFSLLTFVIRIPAGSENCSPLIVLGKNKAESCIHSFLLRRKEDPSLSACFVNGQKVWKSRKFFFQLRAKGNLKVLARGCKGETFTFQGKTGTFPFSFVLAHAVPVNSSQMGSMQVETPLNLVFLSMCERNSIQGTHGHEDNTLFCDRKCVAWNGV